MRTAKVDGLPVRAIVLDGFRRLRAEKRKDRVTARLLDPVAWAVTAYDQATGAFTLTRGAWLGRAVDQFAVAGVDDSPTETRAVTGTVFVWIPAVRQAALARAQGRCEWCGQAGFETPAGEVFLETHHVVPLSEGGPDVAENVVAVCPNHHREAHHGVARSGMRAHLLSVV